jgi:hypothetical protein
MTNFIQVDVEGVGGKKCICCIGQFEAVVQAMAVDIK